MASNYPTNAEIAALHKKLRAALSHDRDVVATVLAAAQDRNRLERALREIERMVAEAARLSDAECDDNDRLAKENAQLKTALRETRRFVELLAGLGVNPDIRAEARMMIERIDALLAEVDRGA